MRSIRQLLRQPLKTLSGMLLVALAVSVLCISFSQTLAAATTAAQLKDSFMTVALPTEKAAAAAQWIDSFTAENPDIVLADVRHGLASAYIPALTVDNYTNHLHTTSHQNNNYQYEPAQQGYSAAMLEITVTGLQDVLGTGMEEHYRIKTDEEGFSSITTEYTSAMTDCYTIGVLGTVERAIGLEEGFQDPTGYSIILYLRIPSENALQDLGITVGERYLVYSENYLDLDWTLRSNLVNEGRVRFWEDSIDVPTWALDSLQIEEVWGIVHYVDEFGNLTWEHGLTGYRYKCRIGDLLYGTTGSDDKLFRTIELTLQNKAELPLFVWERDEDGNLLSGKAVQEHTYSDSTGNETTISLEEFQSRYQNPTIVHLEGTAEEFLASEAGFLWQQTLEDIQINANSFPVVGVENMLYVADFASGKARIVEGRDFTVEELSDGSKVCILSQTLAQANGLGVGDTISAQFFTYDYGNPYQEFIHDGDGVVNPTAYHFRSQTMELCPEETYTIVGLYEQDTPWGLVDNDFFQFTPNTIFAPKASVTGDMDYSDTGMFRTFVLDGDRMYDMQILSVEAGFDGAFCYCDNGYSDLAESLRGYQQAAQQMLPLGIAVYSVLMALYLFLFPGRQGKELAMMDSFGAATTRKLGHSLASCLGILIPGTVLGAWVSLQLWQYVSNALADYMETGVTIILDEAQLWYVAGLQALAVLAATALISLVLSKTGNLMRRK